MRLIIFKFAVFSLFSVTSATAIAALPGDASCAAMDPAANNIIHVNTTHIGQLQAIINAAKPGNNILFEDGIYRLNGVRLWISKPGLSLRSASGNPDAVILDGNYRTSEIITIAASNTTIAEMTITRAATHPVHIVSSDSGDTFNTHLYRLKIVDPGEQAIKINPHKPGYYVDNGSVACSSILLTDAGRPHVSRATGGCYTGGIDAHQARGWWVRDNIIEGFWCNSGLSEHAIHFWRGSRDTIVERNSLKNNARGIGFGLMDRGSARSYSDDYCKNTNTSYIGHYGGTIKNNRIHVSSEDLLSSADGFDCGICLASACKTTVVHNSVVSTGRNFSSIEWRFKGSSGIEIFNNLTSHSLRARDGGSARLAGNLSNVDLSLFVNARSGDLHLSPQAAAAIDQAVTLPPGVCDFDFENDIRDSMPDIGADEFRGY